MAHGRLQVTDRIVDADLCTGCGACAALVPNRVRLAYGEAGFLRPVSETLRRKEAGTILSVCPGRGQSGVMNGAQMHSLWGGFDQAMQGFAADPVVRFAGASGGALSAVLIDLLETGAIDGAVQVRADPAHPTRNITVVSRTRADILAASASRYAPSAPLLDVPRFLETGGTYAFVGKPCDIAAMRRWGDVDPRIGQVFPILVSFFCAGVPSTKGASAVLDHMGMEEAQVRSFRYRGHGWPGPTEAADATGRVARMRYQDSWGGVLSGHVQARCKICADGSGVAADIAFGDAWQTDEQGYPSFEEDDGVSLILMRTKRGSAVVEAAIRRGALQRTELDVSEIEAMQPGQVRRRTELLGRLMGRVMAGKPIPKYRNMGVWACARRIPVFRTLRAMLGMLRRSLLRRQQS